MFDDLQKRLSSAFKKFRVSGVLTEANMREGLREVRTALLEADVNYKVVQDELVELVGPSDSSIRFEKAGPTVLMMCGLQGSGKTTTTGKLARLLLSQGRKPLMVAADLQRPAAIEQLKVIGQQLNIPV